MAGQRGLTKRYRLKPELVPGPLWGKSVYRAIGRRKAWKEIRLDVQKMSGGKCEICGTNSSVRFYCHEKWRYSDKHRLATLIGFGWICELCSHATHYGRALQIDVNYPGLIEEVLEHMIRVNNSSRSAIEKMIARKFTLWNKRSGLDWNQVISAKLIKKYPILRGIRL